MQYVTETLPGYEIKHVAGDGLCILRSFKEAVKTVSDITVSIEDLQLYLRREILHQFEFYREFLTELRFIKGARHFLVKSTKVLQQRSC